MIRRSRPFRQSTAHAATFVSLLAIAACGGGENERNEAPSFEGLPGTPTPSAPAPGSGMPGDGAPGDGVTPTGNEAPAPVDTAPTPSETPGDLPIAPSEEPGAGNGSGAGNMPPPGNEGEPPVTEPPPGEEPPPAEEPPPGEEPPPNEEPPVEEPPLPEGPEFVENSGADCPLPAFPDTTGLPTVQLLPDPFTKLDGTRMTTRAEWRCRRQELKESSEQYLFGDKPARPDSVTGSVTNDNITVNVSHQGQTTSFSATIQRPNGANGPVPALVSVGGFAHNNLVLGEGVAIINFQPFSVGDEAGSRENKTGAFYDIYGNTSFSGLLAAWAWGVSRIIDVVEQSGDNVIQVDRMAVAGCSRFGKAAFAIGALDERIALTIPFESGSAGVPIWRGIPGEGAQSPQSAFGEQHWLGDNFGNFVNAGGVNRLPVDTHEVVALVAPRGLLILDNPHIANLGPESAHVAALAGAEVFAALGVRQNISYHSAVQDGSHCAARTEHQEPLRQNLRKFLLGTGNQPGAIVAAGQTTGNLAEWRNWTTPNLQ